MRKLTIPEFHAELKAQGVTHEDFAFVCPMCAKVQSGRDLIAAGAGKTFDDVESYLGFSCVGRWTDAGPPPKAGKTQDGCNWTLGGLFSLHKLEIIDAKGETHPTFEPASPDAARAHAARFVAEVAHVA